MEDELHILCFAPPPTSEVPSRFIGAFRDKEYAERYRVQVLLFLRERSDSKPEELEFDNYKLETTSLKRRM